MSSSGLASGSGSTSNAHSSSSQHVRALTSSTDTSSTSAPTHPSTAPSSVEPTRFTAAQKGKGRAIEVIELSSDDESVAGAIELPSDDEDDEMHVVEPTSQSIVTAIPTPASIPLPSPRPTSSTTHSPAPQAIGITDGAVEGASDSLPSDLRRSEEATKEPTSIEEEEDELASDDGAFSEGTVGSRLSGRSRAPTTPYARGFGSRSSLSTDERRVWKLKWSADEIACLRRIVLASDAPINWEAVASDLARECPPAEGPYRLASGCSQRFVRLNAEVQPPVSVLTPRSTHYEPSIVKNPSTPGGSRWSATDSDAMMGQALDRRKRGLPMSEVFWDKLGWSLSVRRTGKACEWRYHAIRKGQLPDFAPFASPAAIAASHAAALASVTTTPAQHDRSHLISTENKAFNRTDISKMRELHDMYPGQYKFIARKLDPPRHKRDVKAYFLDPASCMMLVSDTPGTIARPSLLERSSSSQSARGSGVKHQWSHDDDEKVSSEAARFKRDHGVDCLTIAQFGEIGKCFDPPRDGLSVCYNRHGKLTGSYGGRSNEILPAFRRPDNAAAGSVSPSTEDHSTLKRPRSASSPREEDVAPSQPSSKRPRLDTSSSSSIKAAALASSLLGQLDLRRFPRATTYIEQVVSRHSSSSLSSIGAPEPVPFPADNDNTVAATVPKPDVPRWMLPSPRRPTVYEDAMDALWRLANE